MPLSAKGNAVLKSMMRTYREPKKAKSVFYASAAAGRIKGVHRKGKNRALASAGRKK